MSVFQRAVAAHWEVLEALHGLEDQVLDVAERLADCLDRGGTIFWLGNGGSAADAQHLAAELVGRYEGVDRRALASIALTTDSSVLTSVANDHGFETVFARQIEALARPGDVVVAISTSGDSPNVLAAARTARERGAFTVGLCGRDGGALRGLVDSAIVVPSSSAARVQEAHILIGHVWCEHVDDQARRADA